MKTGGTDSPTIHCSVDTTVKMLGKADNGSEQNQSAKLTTDEKDTKSMEKREKTDPTRHPRHGRSCSEKTNPHNVWLGKTGGLNFMSIYDQLGLPPGTLKICSGRAREQ